MKLVKYKNCIFFGQIHILHEIWSLINPSESSFGRNLSEKSVFLGISPSWEPFLWSNLSYLWPRGCQSKIWSHFEHRRKSWKSSYPEVVGSSPPGGGNFFLHFGTFSLFGEHFYRWKWKFGPCFALTKLFRSKFELFSPKFELFSLKFNIFHRKWGQKNKVMRPTRCIGRITA